MFMAALILIANKQKKETTSSVIEWLKLCPWVHKEILIVCTLVKTIYYMGDSWKYSIE